MSPKTRKTHEDFEAGFAALVAAERSGRISAAPLPAPLLARILADAADHGPQTSEAHRLSGFGFLRKWQAGLSAAFGPLTGGLATAGLAGLMGLGFGLWGGGTDGALEGLTTLWRGGVETVELWPEGVSLLEEG